MRSREPLGKLRKEPRRPPRFARKLRADGRHVPAVDDDADDIGRTDRLPGGGDRLRRRLAGEADQDHRIGAARRQSSGQFVFPVLDRRAAVDDDGFPVPVRFRPQALQQFRRAQAERFVLSVGEPEPADVVGLRLGRRRRRPRAVARIDQQCPRRREGASLRQRARAGGRPVPGLAADHRDDSGPGADRTLVDRFDVLRGRSKLDVRERDLFGLRPRPAQGAKGGLGETECAGGRSGRQAQGVSRIGSGALRALLRPRRLFERFDRHDPPHLCVCWSDAAIPASDAAETMFPIAAEICCHSSWFRFGK